ncbi:MAG: hypothetical protein RLY49_340 [Candidatus Parcubacteria bacterium]|jgi:hypothetical protein
MVKKLLFRILIILIFVCIVLVLHIFLKQPTHNKTWTDDAQILPDVTFGTSTIEIKNIRDWRYTQGNVVSKDFYTESFDPEKITSVYFLLNPFGKWEGVGHTFFLFEFEDQNTVSISVEARREEGVPYSAVRGLFNTYEMWYVWGSGADLFSRRAIYHNEDLYMYPLLISKDTAKRLFIDLAQQTEKLETQPEFYNTVTSNCTNILADSANRVNKGSIPWTFARIFTGYSDNKLYDLKLIPHNKTFEEEFEDARIDVEIKNILNSDEKISKENFWKELKNKLKNI